MTAAKTTAAIDITNMTSDALDALLPISDVGYCAWADLDNDDRAEFTAALVDSGVILRLRKNEERYYRYMGYSAKRIAGVACSDTEHAKSAYEYGRLAHGYTFEEMCAKPGDAADAALDYMS